MANPACAVHQSHASVWPWEATAAWSCVTKAIAFARMAISTATSQACRRKERRMVRTDELTAGALWNEARVSASPRRVKIPAGHGVKQTLSQGAFYPAFEPQTSRDVYIGVEHWPEARQA